MKSRYCPFCETYSINRESEIPHFAFHILEVHSDIPQIEVNKKLISLLCPKKKKLK